MKKCCVCRNALTDQPAVLFIGKDDELKEICPKCEKMADALTESDDADSIKSAVNYFYTCLKSATDPEVAAFLKEAIRSNSDVVREVEELKVKSSPVDTSKTVDYFSEKEHKGKSGGSFWIDGLRIVTWITAIAVIISGISMAAIFFRTNTNEGYGIGFLIIIWTLISAFLSVAWTMVLLDAAQDISEIKVELKNSNFQSHRGKS